MLVSRIEETDDAPRSPAASRPPLYVGRTLLYPNLGEPISKSAAKELPFYFTLYGDVGAGRRHRAAAAQRPGARRGAGDAARRRRLPACSTSAGCRSPTLPAGTYELRIIVKDAGASCHGRRSSR